jgi:putative tricarboxylic transport membrane protein
MPTLLRRMRIPALLAALALVATACVDDGGGGGGGDSGGGGFPSRPVRIMAPAAPGGGWDQTSRIAQEVMEQAKIVPTKVEVFNVPGAGGTIGLAQLANDKGNGHLIMTMGLVMIGAIETNDSAVDLTQVTPIAQLTSEYEAIVVPADSKYKTLEDFAADLKADPSKLAIAGGSAGGTDQILAGLMAKAVGADPKKVNYVAFSGGGEALAAILGGKVAAGISGIGEFSEQVKAGKLRALAVSAPERVASMDAPTMKEAGVDVELANWRGMVAPPDLPADQKQGLIDLVTKMHDSQQWKDALAKNGWDDTFMAGDEFATFLTAEQARVKTIITELGLAK